MTRDRLFRVVALSDSRAGRIFDGAIIALILVNVLAMIVETLPGPERPWLAAVEVFSVAFFSVEIGLRIFVADRLYPHLPAWRARLRYCLSPLALVDFLAVIYFYLPVVFRADLRALRTLRLFKIVKIGRHSATIATLGRVVQQQRRPLLSTLGVIFFVVLVTSSLVYQAEVEAGAATFSSIFDAFWWGLSVLTTAGGEVAPTTVIGKAASLLIAVLGLALIAVPTGIITAELLEALESGQPRPGPDPGPPACPTCGR